MNTRIGKTIFAAAAVMMCALVLSAVLALPAFTQGISLGVKGGILSGEFSVFTEAFLAGPVSASLSIGVQSSSLSISAWTTIYFLPSTQIVAPYLGFGANVLLFSSGPQASLMLIGGVRSSPFRWLSVFMEGVLLARLPSFNPALDIRVGLAARF